MKATLLFILVIPLYAITYVGGEIIENTVWGPTGNPPDTIYELINYVDVNDTVTLTIQPGTRIQSPSHMLWIRGRLVAVGKNDSLIKFTSSLPVPHPNAWTGIIFISVFPDTSYFENCIIEYADVGVNIDHGYYVKFYNTNIQYCNRGIETVRKIMVSNCIINDINYSGIYIHADHDSVVPCLGNNLFIRNNIALDYYVNNCSPKFAGPSTFQNNIKDIEIMGMAIITDTVVWHLSNDRVVSWIESRIDIETTGVLIITPGNTFKMRNAIYVDGCLLAQGTETDSVIFTSIEDNPSMGDWHGICNLNLALVPDTSILSYCKIEYANEVMLNPVIMQNCTARYLRYGLWCGGHISHCNIHDCNLGIHLEFVLTHLRSNYIHNNFYGMQIGMLIDTLLPFFDEPNTFYNNQRDINFQGPCRVGKDWFWNPTDDTVTCWTGCCIVIDTSYVFQIAPGNCFRSSGGYLQSYGNIIANGTPDRKIQFKNCKIIIEETADSSVFNNCIIDSADWGIGGWGKIFLSNSSIRFNSNGGIGLLRGSATNCEISNNANYGVFCSEGSMTIANCIINNNRFGIYCDNGPDPLILNNRIFDNYEFGVFNYENNYWINAEYNWWGDSSGPCDTSAVDTLYNPSGLGDRVSDHVDYDPWLHIWPCIGEGGNPKVIIKPDNYRAIIFKGQLITPEDKLCRIFDITGREIKGHNLAPGIYFIEINGVVSRKVIKIE